MLCFGYFCGGKTTTGLNSVSSLKFKKWRVWIFHGLIISLYELTLPPDCSNAQCLQARGSEGGNKCKLLQEGGSDEASGKIYSSSKRERGRDILRRKLLFQKLWDSLYYGEKVEKRDTKCFQHLHFFKDWKTDEWFMPAKLRRITRPHLVIQKIFDIQSILGAE